MDSNILLHAQQTTDTFIKTTLLMMTRFLQMWLFLCAFFCTGFGLTDQQLHPEIDELDALKQSITRLEDMVGQLVSNNNKLTQEVASLKIEMSDITDHKVYDMGHPVGEFTTKSALIFKK